VHPDMPPKSEALANVLDRPLVARPAVDPLVAPGYVSATDNDPQNGHAFAAALGLWSCTQGGALGAWLFDVLSKPCDVVQPDFAGLIDVRPTYPRTAALLVEGAALSPQVGTALAIKAVIRRTTAGLHVLDQVPVGALT
jgi:hypothetical protein